MFNFFKRKRNKKGFTLVELLTVMFVVGAIAAVALPSYKRAVEKSRAAQGIATLESIAKAQMNHNVLRGNFSPTFNGLPIELRDNESAVVTGSEFSDNYFQFTLSDTDSIAVAKRQNGEYELSVDYVTGRLYCSPATNSVCMRFGLEERDASVGQGGMGGSTTTPEISDGRVCEGGYCYDYKDGQQVAYCVADSSGKDCIKDGTYCDKDSRTCKTYQDGKLVKTCRSNIDFSDCAEDDMDGIRLDENGNPFEGLVCGEKTCNYWQKGKIVGTCDAYRGEPTEKCYESFGLSGVVCEAGKCTTYANGKPILTCSKEEGFCVDNNGEKCIINDLGNACKEKTEGKEGLVCNEKECIFYDKEGNPIGSCSAENEGQNKECYKAFGLSGKFCDEKMCYEFENGQIKGECPATNNGENKECYEAFGLSGRICDEKMCYEIENGKIQGQCSSENDGENRECYEAFKLSGTLCDDKGCGVFDKGEMVMVCDKESKMCTDLKTGEKCAANATFDGCKPLIGFVCDEKGCTYYDEDGKPQGTCPAYANGNPVVECYEQFGLTGEVCDGVGDKCFTFENGQMVAQCNLKEKICYDATTGKQCEPNENWTGCAKEEGGKAGFVCDEKGCTYYDEDGKPQGTCGVQENGKPDLSCYEKMNLTGEACDGYGLCITYENGKKVAHCNIKEKKCYNDVTGKECTPNENWTGCAKAEGGKAGFVCTDTDCTYYDEEGNKVGTCGMFKNGKPVPDCYEMFGLTGQTCDGADQCYNFENGKATLICSLSARECYNPATDKTCPANSDFTGCGYDTGNVPNIKDGTACDEKTGICYTFKNGELISQCTLGKDCDSIKNGYLCGSDGCSIIKDGKEIMVCSIGKDICFNKDGECKPNATYTACSDGSILGLQTGLVCNEGDCTYYDEYGNPKGSCGRYPNGQASADCYDKFGLTGQSCSDEDKVCYNFENGKPTLICSISEKICTDKATGKKCPANKDLTGCAEGSGGQKGVVCDDAGCTYYNDKGVAQGTCDNEDQCYEKFGLTGEVCKGTEASKTSCATYNNGQVTSYCKISSKTGEWVCYDKATGKTCEPNDNYTGCAISSGSTTQNGLVCNGFTCTEYKDGEVVNTCANNGNGGCIKGEGQETTCINGTCQIYNDGELAYTCKEGSSAAGGCDRNGFVCDTRTCADYTYGTANEGTTCYNNGNGGCIKGEGTETGYCDKKRCLIYQDGKYAYDCQVGSSASGGCDRNGMVCDSADCYDYTYGHADKESHCYNNGSGGCIKGEGTEMGYCETDGSGCKIYVNGKYSYSCKPKDSGAGGCDRNGFVCDEGKTECYGYEFGGLTGETCHSNGNGGCIKGEGDEMACIAGVCRMYKDGQLVNTCTANTAGTGCDSGAVQNGFICIGTECKEYVDGEVVSSCYNNGKDECIKGKGEEYICYDGGDCTYYVDGKKQYSCIKGYAGEGGCDLNGYICHDKYCYEYRYGNKTGNSCYSNNAGTGCITGKGVELGWCDGDLCRVFVEGTDAYSCQKGSNKENGCDRNGQVCDGINCAQYVFGLKQAGTTCFRTYSGGGCITGNGTELGYCGNTDGSCNVFVEGKQQYSCVKGSSGEGGCDRNGRVCSGFSCFDYVYGKTTGSGCYSNGQGGCIEGKGTETVCIKDQCNVYKDGKLITEGCPANDEGTGCKEDGGSGTNGVVCNAGTCIEYKDGKKTGRTLVAFKEKGYCIEYMDGKETGNTFELNKEGDGCMV